MTELYDDPGSHVRAVQKSSRLSEAGSKMVRKGIGLRGLRCYHQTENGHCGQ